MSVGIVLAVIVMALLLLAALGGAESRDGRDWQPRSQWQGRRGTPLD